MNEFQDYTLEGLSIIFTKQAEIYENDAKKFGDFNLCRSLAVICSEIEKLKHRLDKID